jgi:hypothetical protein
MNATDPSEETTRRIQRLLEDLPLENLEQVEHFIRFIRGEEKSLPKNLYPTIAVPASTLTVWTNLLPEGYEGDALLDTEALYDDV